MSDGILRLPDGREIPLALGEGEEVTYDAIVHEDGHVEIPERSRLDAGPPYDEEPDDDTIFRTDGFDTGARVDMERVAELIGTPEPIPWAGFTGNPVSGYDSGPVANPYISASEQPHPGDALSSRLPTVGDIISSPAARAQREAVSEQVRLVADRLGWAYDKPLEVARPYVQENLQHGMARLRERMAEAQRLEDERVDAAFGRLPLREIDLDMVEGKAYGDLVLEMGDRYYSDPAEVSPALARLRESLMAYAADDWDRGPDVDADFAQEITRQFKRGVKAGLGLATVLLGGAALAGLAVDRARR